MTRKILIVGNDRGLREVLADILRTEGFEPLIVQQFSDGVALAREQQLGAVLADLEGPIYESRIWEPLARLHGAALEVPIILCSAHPQTNRADFERFGVAAIIAMPFEIDELLSTLAQVLAN